MPRCPRCRSAPITIMFGAFPLVFCGGCGARWTQEEPALLASARYPVA